MTQSPSDASVDEIPSGDLETAKVFGKNFATTVSGFHKHWSTAFWDWNPLWEPLLPVWTGRIFQFARQQQTL